MLFKQRENNKEDPEKLAQEQEKQIDQIKSDMETLKTKKVLEAKEHMQSEKKKVQDEKNKLMEDAKNKFAQNRPTGNNSQIGENLGDFIDQQISSPKSKQVHLSGTQSQQISPKNGASAFDADNLLNFQELLKITQDDAENNFNTLNLQRGLDIVITRQSETLLQAEQQNGPKDAEKQQENEAVGDDAKEANTE